MNGSELRIGNIVERIMSNGSHGNYEIVSRIENDTYGRLPSSYCKGVRLNPDWLLKLGAKPTTPLLKDFWISITNIKGELHFETFSNTDEIVTSLKSQFADLILDRITYVHELQNLYYCLTKKELEAQL